MYMTSFIQYLIEEGWQIQAVPVANGWLEVDTYSELMVYQEMYRQGTLSRFWSPGCSTEQRSVSE